MPTPVASVCVVSTTAVEERTLLLTPPKRRPRTRVNNGTNEQFFLGKTRLKLAVVGAMISLIAFTLCLVFYWHHTSNHDHPSSSSITFGQLAASMVWTAHIASLQAVTHVLTAEMVPEQATVADVRKLLLKTRNLLDVFSPVYPATNDHNSNQKQKQKVTSATKPSSKHKHKDWWVDVRIQYKKGYEIIGEFVDLSHAHILYDNITCDHRRQKVLDWKSDFLHFCNASSTPRNDHGGSEMVLLDEYLRQPLISRRYAAVHHPHESKFFWKTVILPNQTSPYIRPNSAAAPTLRRLAVHQLQLAQTYLSGTLSLHPPATNSSSRGVESSSIIHNHTRAETLATHETFHNLRKTLRALCDEYELFGPLFLPLSTSSSATIEQPPENGTATAVTIVTTTTTTATNGATAATVTAMQRLVEARTLLGDLNDDFTAYLFYVQHKQYRDDVAALVEQIDQKLLAFCDWTTMVNFSEQINVLLQAMMTAST